MKRLFATAALAVILGASVGTAYADDFLGSYVARMSWKDHEASDGYKLDTAAQVVRQDRANVHRHIHTDEEDDIDSWFTSNAKRSRFEQLLNKPSAMSSGTRRAILRGEPLVEVEVYRNSVRVTVVD